MKKSKKIIIGMFITAFLFFITSIIISFIITPSIKYKNNVYCSQYDYKANPNTLYYDLEKETLCSYKICFEKVN